MPVYSRGEEQARRTAATRKAPKTHHLLSRAGVDYHVTPYRGSKIEWKDDWQAPRLKDVTFVAREEIANNGLISQVEVWRAARGYYVYHRYHTGLLSLSSGRHKQESTGLRRAKEEKKALEASVTGLKRLTAFNDNVFCALDLDEKKCSRARYTGCTECEQLHPLHSKQEPSESGFLTMYAKSKE